MVPTRRQFVRQLGIMMASLVASGCLPSTPTTTSTLAPAIPGSGSKSSRERLRSCWLGLDWLAQQTQDNALGDHERQTRAWKKISNNHRAALNELVATGELSSAAADRVQAAFGEATYHVWRSNSGMTCYEPTPLDGTYMDTKRRLIDQAQRLDEIGKSAEIDPCTIARIQAAIEREIAFLIYPEQEIKAMYHEIVETTQDIEPSISAFGLPIDPATAEAARFLVELLSEESGFADLPAQVATCLPPPSPTPVPWAGNIGSPQVDQLRGYWLKFDWLAEEMCKDPENAQQVLARFVADHWLLIKVLWTAGYFSDTRMGEPLQVQVVFSTVAYHTWCSNAPDGCSPSEEMGRAFAGAGRLVQQVDRLAAVAENVESTDHVLIAKERAQAQAAVEQAIALIMHAHEMAWELCGELIASVEDDSGFLSLDEVDEYGWEIAPGIAETTRIIVDLMLFGKI